MEFKNVEEFKGYIMENCFVEAKDGTAIGSTSGGFRPLFYSGPEDDVGKEISGWTRAFHIFNQHNK